MPRKNPTPADGIATLARLAAEGKRAVHLKPKASETAIRDMQTAAKKDLGEPVPEEFVALLRISNGVQINGAYFKEAENLVPENLDVVCEEVIILGSD